MIIGLRQAAESCSFDRVGLQFEATILLTVSRQDIESRAPHLLAVGGRGAN